MKQLYAIYDNKARIFFPPFDSYNDATAIRYFTKTMEPGANNPLCAYPSDYDLYHIGYYDDDHGRPSGIDPNVLVMTGKTACALNAPPEQQTMTPVSKELPPEV